MAFLNQLLKGKGKTMSSPVFEIEVASHFFIVKNPNPRAMPAIIRFCQRYTLYNWVKKTSSKPVYEPVKVFATRTKDNREFRFHIGQFNDFLDFIEKDYIVPSMYTITYREMFEPVKIQCIPNPKYILRDYQTRVKSFITESAADDNRSRLVALGTGMGKEQPLYSKIKIPGGWTTMGQMQVGSKVIARDGSATTVIGVYPQGVKPVYRVHFADGRYADCGYEHLWKVWQNDKSQVYKVLDTRKIQLMLGMNTYKKRLYVDLPEPEQSLDVDLPIDPYILGIILGDGSTVNGAITITNPDVFIMQKVSAKLPEGVSVVPRVVRENKCPCFGINTGKNIRPNPIITVLRDYSLMGKRSWEKFIPDVYLNASSRQRLELLQGLLDTDGTVGKAKDNHRSGTISFSSTSKELAEAVQYLVRSLGGIAKIVSRTPYFTHKGIRKAGRTDYRVHIRHKRPEEFFTLPKKYDRLSNINQYSPTLKLRINRIELISYEECQCIMVDHPEHLYITDDFVVTHNTVCSLIASVELGHRILINILPTYIERWIDALKDILQCDNKDILVIQGSNQMRDLIDLAEEGRLEAKYIILSLRTVQNYIKSYEANPYDLESEGYAVNPDQLCQHLGVGTVIIDETHQHLHAVFKFLVYTHVPKVIALSATLLSDDSTIEKIQHMMFPKEIRFDEVKMDKYIKCYAVAYGFEDMYRSKIRVNEFGSKNYSHLAFEKSLMRCKKTAGNYMDMINYLVRIGYADYKQPGDKAIIFVATIAMANMLTSYLKMKHTNLDVRRYVEDDPFENVMEADIRVTTVLSSGTAIDIPQLTCAIQTVNLKSTVSNVQSLGRLRKLKDRDVRFYFTFCEEIKKHHEYYHHRKQIFADRTVSIKDFRYPYLL